MSETALQTVTPSSSAGLSVAASHTPNNHNHSQNHSKNQSQSHSHTSNHTPKSHKASKSSSASGGDVPRFRPRACARCSISKLKCNWPSEPGEAPCERCARSRSECVLPSLKPRGPRRGNPTRVGQLEQKIDGIMSLLTASKHISKTGPKKDEPAAAAEAPTVGATWTPGNGSATPSGSGDSFTSPTSTPTPTPPTVEAFLPSSSSVDTKTEAQSSIPSPENYTLASSDRAERGGSPPSAGVPSASSQSPVPYPQNQQQLPQFQQQQQLPLPNDKITLPPISPSVPVSPAPTSSSLTRGDRAESTLPPPTTPSQFSLYRLPQPQQPQGQPQLQQQQQRPPSRQYLLPPYQQPVSVSPRSSATSSLLQHPHYSASSNVSSNGNDNASVTLPPIMSVAPIEQPTMDIAPGIKLSYYDADAALSEYRRTYLPHFPFVPIPPNLSAYDLSRQSPLLFRLIVLVVYPQPADANLNALADAKLSLREQIAQRIVVGGENTVELLQSLLLYVAWLCEPSASTSSAPSASSTATPLLQLALGIVYELQLDEQIHDLDEIRSVLGCFCTCSMLSLATQRSRGRSRGAGRSLTPVLSFTQNMTDCCDRLLAARDYQSDELVVALVKVYQVAQQIESTLFDDASGASSPTGMRLFALLSVTMASLHKELMSLVDRQPQLVRQNSHFWVHLYSVLARLYEPALTAKPGSASMSSDRLRTEALWSCIRAATDYFDAYTAIPVSVIAVLPSTLVGPQFAYMVRTLTRLLELDDADWNQDQVRRCIDIVGVTQQLEDHLKTADGTTAGGKKTRMIDSQAYKMYWLRAWYTVKGRKPAANGTDVDMDKMFLMPDGREVSLYYFDSAYSMVMSEE